MVNHKATTILALALLAQPIQATRDDGSQALKTVGIIGGICLGAYAIGSGISYLCTPSNDALIDKARRADGDVQGRYGSCMHYLKSRNYELHEGDLCCLAQTYVGGSVDEYKRGMRDALHRLQTACSELSDRMYSLERKGECGRADYRAMEEWKRQLKTTERALENALDSVSRHSGYCALYACAQEIQAGYGEMLSIMERYGQNRAACAQYMRELIALQGINSRNAYPTIAYLESLNDKMRTFERVIQHCAYASNLLAQAHGMLGSMTQARAMLLADDRYAFEMQDRERARREEERLRIERERVAAEQRKADAAQRQAYAAEQHNREMARQNDILREQNRIERDRSERHRYCDRNRCCCNQVVECPIFTIEVIR